MQLPDLLVNGRRRIFVQLIGNGLAQGGLAVASAWLVMGVFDRLGTGDSGMILFLAGLCVVILSSALLRWRERIDAEAIGQDYVKAVRQRLYSRLLDANPRALARRRKGALLLKFVGDLSAVRRWISLGLSRLLVAGVAVAMAMAALAWLYWPFALGVVLMLGTSALWILRQGGSVRRAIAEARRCQANLSANVTEKLGNLATVQAFGQMRRERKLMRRQSQRLLEASVRKAASIGRLRAVIDGTAGGAVVTVLALAYLVPPANLSAGMVAAVISIIGFLTPPLRDLGRVQEYWLAAQVARDNLQAITRTAPRLRNRRGGEPLRVKEGRITLDAVTVRGALNGVHAEAAPGARIAVLGPNGSGKSTLLGVVGRLFDPDKGRVLIDGQDVSKVHLSSLRRQVAYVSVDIPLIRGSLRKNLCYGAGKVSDEQLREVVADCKLDDLLARMPGGFDGRIAESGADLSQGERVRVGLARALLLRPKILLLDEAEANLDTEALHALDDVVKRFEGTVLMATHRRGALHTCNALWALRGGRLEAMGNPDALLERHAKLVTLHGTAAVRHPVVASLRLQGGQ